MLTLESTTDALEALYADYKEEAAAVYRELSHLAEVTTLKADIDLLRLKHESAKGTVIFILEGYFRLIYSKKVVRLYSENDFVGAHHHVADVILTSEFASQVALFKWTDLAEIFTKTPALAARWFHLLDMENKLNLGLCAQLVDERVQPSLELRQLKADDIIIQEGSEADEIYEMISGIASVSVGNKTVGEINTGEIFGEMSFLLECPRTATVRAETACCVRVVTKEDFFSLIEVDRHLSASIAKTMARRVIELNQRLAGDG
jgi:hypothetical protein